MAVYTPLGEDEIRALLSRYALGQLREFRGIAEGVENSNFLLETAQGKFILTLFEKRVQAQDLPYYLELMEWWSTHGISCPRPVHDREGRALQRVKGKSAVIVTFLDGGEAKILRSEHFKAVGALAAEMHLSARGFSMQRSNALSLPAWSELAQKIGAAADTLSPGLAAKIAAELQFLEAHWPKGLPSGPVHADLFPDNVFFKNGQLSGVIDFYFACNEAWAYDLAVCVNAWAFRKEGGEWRFNEAFADALLQAYATSRNAMGVPFSDAEKRAMPVLLRGAALRFLLTRAHDLIFHPEGALVTPKDPLEYLAKLAFFQNYKGLK